VADPSAETEAALIAKAQQGDRDAFGDLVRLHHEGVLNVVFRMCGDVEVAEDAAQDAFIQAWLHLLSFRPGTSLRNWIYRIAVNSALDALRREPKTPLVDLETLSMPDSSAGPETVLLEKERAVAVLVLREYGGLSYQEIAAALDIPIGTVMSRLNYARDRLKELLKPQLTDMEIAYD
jgi:RNA polymerase sigma-70 factor, ECF subfamily